MTGHNTPSITDRTGTQNRNTTPKSREPSPKSTPARVAKNTPTGNHEKRKRKHKTGNKRTHEKHAWDAEIGERKVVK